MIFKDIIILRGDFMKNNDAIISEKVVSGIRDQLNLAANEVNVHVLEGVVQLTGFVDVLAEKQDVERIAIETKDVKGVVNDLTIAMDKNIPDKKIQSYAKEILENTDISNVLTAKVSDGNAIVEGKVLNQRERKQALREVSKVFGVKNVVNHIEVEPKPNRVDLHNELVNEITNSTVNTANITTEIHNGKVVLDGFVKNKKEKEALVNMAEGLDGVHKVVDRLEENPRANF